jgi:hypothetical protein
MLPFYERLVRGLSNRLAWRCVALYRDNLSGHHRRAWTGLFIDRADRASFEQFTLLDVNRHCLARSAQRLARYQPLLCEANLVAPIGIELEPADSVGLTYVLHVYQDRCQRS